MDDQHKLVTRALMFRIPEIVSWNISSDDQEWRGDTLSEFIDCLGSVDRGNRIT